MNHNEFRNILGAGFHNIQKRHGRITIADVEAEVINQACRFIIENFSDQLKSVHDIDQLGSAIRENTKFRPIAKMFINTAVSFYPNEYGEKEKDAGLEAICQNISWAGMWDFLRDYFQKKHGESIDNIEGEPMIFYSQAHKRFENDVLVSESKVERNVNINFLNDKLEVIVSVEPTLSAKKGRLVSNSDNILVYDGSDPDYRFIIKLDEYEEVEMFILELPKRSLKLYYS